MMVMLLTAATSFASINLQKYSMSLTAATATAGKTVDVTLSMKNDKAIASWATTLALPEGVTFVSATTAGTRYGEVTPAVTSQVNKDGTVSLMCEPDAAMTGTYGAVATITLKVDATVAAGAYTLTLKGATLVDIADKTWTRTEDVEATLTVEEAQGVAGDVNGDGMLNGADIQALLNLIAAESTDAIADINSDGMVNGADIQALLNLIANAE